MTREATIQRILDIEKIDGADTICSYKVLGWNIVDKIGKFNIGDLCVYVSVDSIVPEIPEFEFLRKHNFRVKSIKLRKTISQGLLLDLSILDTTNFKHGNTLIDEGLDVTDYLNIIHYEKPIPAELRGLIKGNFLFYTPKTDEVRCENYPEIIKELNNILVYSTIKYDGTSFTCSYKDGDFNVCSRNNTLKIEGNEDNTYVKMIEQYDLKNKMIKYNKNISLQGELCGNGIQKNLLELKTHKVFMFNVWFIDEQRYGNMLELIEVCDDLGLDIVQGVDMWIFNDDIETLHQKTKMFYPNTKNQIEGIVIRPVFEMFSKTIKNRMSFKIVNREFLIKNKE